MPGGLTPKKGILAAAFALAALALAPSTAAAVAFFRGDFPVGTHPTAVAVGNFNGGAPDLAVADEGSDAVSILLGNGFGQFTPAGAVAAGSLPSSVVAGRVKAGPLAHPANSRPGQDKNTPQVWGGKQGVNGARNPSTPGGG